MERKIASPAKVFNFLGIDLRGILSVENKLLMVDIVLVLYSKLMQQTF